MKEQGYYKEYYHNNKEKFAQYREERKERNHIISPEEWEICKKYFENQCAYCGNTEEQSLLEYNESLHREHAINDGADDITNCIPSCKGCNSKKWTWDLNEWYTEDNPIFSFDRLKKIMQWMNVDSFKIQVK